MRERELRALAAQMAERYGLDPQVFVRQIQQESSFNPQARNRRTGATGLGQVMAATAQDPGFGVTPLRDRLDPVENLRFSAEYMAAMLNKYDGDYRLALAAYNAGPGAWTVLVASRALKRRRITWRRSWVGSYGLNQDPMTSVCRPRAPNLGPRLAVRRPSSAIRLSVRR
jgi:soluble lytic murein transglycosylase-like protein